MGVQGLKGICYFTMGVGGLKVLLEINHGDLVWGVDYQA